MNNFMPSFFAKWKPSLSTVRLRGGRVTHFVYTLGSQLEPYTICDKSLMSRSYGITTYVLNGGCKRCNKIVSKDESLSRLLSSSVWGSVTTFSDK